MGPMRSWSWRIRSMLFLAQHIKELGFLLQELEKPGHHVLVQLLGLIAGNTGLLRQISAMFILASIGKHKITYALWILYIEDIAKLLSTDWKRSPNSYS